MPPDEGDVEVLWHRASGRASTPPRHRDAYSPSRPSGDDERGISPGVETLEAGGGRGARRGSSSRAAWACRRPCRPRPLPRPPRRAP